MSELTDRYQRIVRTEASRFSKLDSIDSKLVNVMESRLLGRTTLPQQIDDLVKHKVGYFDWCVHGLCGSCYRTCLVQKFKKTKSEMIEAKREAARKAIELANLLERNWHMSIHNNPNSYNQTPKVLHKNDLLRPEEVAADLLRRWVIHSIPEKQNELAVDIVRDEFAQIYPQYQEMSLFEAQRILDYGGSSLSEMLIRLAELLKKDETDVRMEPLYKQQNSNGSRIQEAGTSIARMFNDLVGSQNYQLAADIVSVAFDEEVSPETLRTSAYHKRKKSGKNT